MIIMNIEDIIVIIKEEIKNCLVSLGYADESFEVVLEQPNDKTHGDYSTNSALRLAKVAQKNPRIVAEELKNKINLEKCRISKLKIAGPGFLNIYLE
mgnify:CR=1 FL=1